MALRILIVEPERHSREGLRSILSSSGHEVSVAEDLSSGFDQLCSGSFDLLLLDADLPPSRKVLVSVVDLLRLARLGQPEAGGILLSSSAEDVPGNLDLLGILAVLEKPVELARLQQAVETAQARAGRPAKPSAAPRS